jgi:hypothetical protein
LRRDRTEFIRGGLSTLLPVVIEHFLVDLVEVEAH